MSLFLSIPSAAKELGISLRQFRRHVTGDGIPTFRIGRAFFITRKDFEEWKKKYLTRGAS